MRNFFFCQIIGILKLFILINPSFLIAQEGEINAIYTSETVLKIDNYSKVSLTEKGKYIILNNDGLKFCSQRFYYGTNSDIVSLSAVIKNLNGKPIKKLKKSEVRDVVANDDISLYTDTRMKYFQLSHNYFPFILEYKVVRKYKQSFSYPSWMPRINYGLLNASSSFKLIAPQSKSINIYERNIDKGLKNNRSNLVEYTWRVDSLPPIADEPFSYSEYWEAPKVMLAPGSFYFEFTGGNNSWIEYGNWISKLNQGRDFLTTKEKTIIDSLIVDIDSDFEKVNILYNYLQQNTRYVSIQEGIGGWQPFTAEYVCENKYGDCKALTNYMYAILKYVGIKSYYTLVKAGNNTSEINTGFPSNQFNHAILMVPIETDTIWLDCTSKISPTGFVERFIADRYVLVVEKDKSYITKTPIYSSEQNIDHYWGTIKVNNDLSGKGFICIKSTAQRSLKSRLLHKNYNARIAKNYPDNLNIPSYQIMSNIHSEEVRDFIPYTFDSINIKVSIAGKKAGPDLFLTYPLEFSFESTHENKERITDIYLPESYSRVDSIQYLLPEGFKLIEETDFTHISEFGSVKCKIESNENQVYLHSVISVNKGRYCKTKIEEFREFIKNIDKIESYEIIVSKF